MIYLIGIPLLVVVLVLMGFYAAWADRREREKREDQNLRYSQSLAELFTLGVEHGKREAEKLAKEEP